MKPFRKNVAIAIDGGGIRGLIATQALAMLEEAAGVAAHDIFRLAVGTSTGSIIAAGIAAGISAAELNRLYLEMGEQVFPTTWRKRFFPLSRYRYPDIPLQEALQVSFGDLRMGDLWAASPQTDLVITTFDLVTNRTLFVKPWKSEYADWPVAFAVRASCTVPTYFPVVEGRFIDGGVGSYANPCYLAAYEAAVCLEWDPAETTLISVGTGRDPYTYNPEDGSNLFAWEWLKPIFGAFLQSAYDQQVHLVDSFFKELDFRRFQVNLREPIEMDDVSALDRLVAYGVRMGRMILNDQTDVVQDLIPKKASGPLTGKGNRYE